MKAAYKPCGEISPKYQASISKTKSATDSEMRQVSARTIFFGSRPGAER